ncbi:MAG: hypothetical protein DME26_01780 [Verrucomicrobia bacterium]|nr:MAG: hypothetical protein DME26_01780 [Verrucomicrobiota bacterium]
MTDGNDFSQSANGIIVSLIKPMKEDLVFRHFQWLRKMHLSATTDFPPLNGERDNTLLTITENR